MKFKWTFAFALSSAFLLFPSHTPAQTLSSETPAVVELTKGLDAKKLLPGAVIQTRLVEPVRFADGTKLPAGAWLNATVAEDDMQIDSKVKLALRFTEARIKNGNIIPIKATILAVETRSVPVPNNPDAVETVLLVPANLNNQADNIDIPGVTTMKNDIKLPMGTKMELALILSK
jgi:hypothetical protein